MATMRAQRLDTASLTFEVTDVEIPSPGPGEVLVQIAFCGICHSDNSLLEGGPGSGTAVRGAPYCRRGDLTGCTDLALMAFAYDGAWAEHTVAQAGGLTRVPDDVPLEQAAILADAVSTPYRAVVHTGQVKVGEAVGVWGAGGVGTHVVQLARLVGVGMNLRRHPARGRRRRGAPAAGARRQPHPHPRPALAASARRLSRRWRASGPRPR